MQSQCLLREAQPKAGEMHIWPSEIKFTRQDAAVLLMTCGDPRKMKQLGRKQTNYFKQEEKKSGPKD